MEGTFDEKIDEKQEKKPMVVLTGPTAVGKTKLSLSLAEAIGGNHFCGFHAGIPAYGYRFGENQTVRDAGDSSSYDRYSGALGAF